MITWGDLRNNIEVEGDYTLAYYDSTDDELYDLYNIEGHKFSDFDDCEVKYIYPDNIFEEYNIIFELSEEDVIEVIGKY